MSTAQRDPDSTHVETMAALMLPAMTIDLTTALRSTWRQSDKRTDTQIMHAVVSEEIERNAGLRGDKRRTAIRAACLQVLSEDCGVKL